MSLLSLTGVKEHQNVIITGKTGLGKTYIACALANKACREGYSALYCRCSRLFQALKMSRVDGTYIKLLDKIARAAVLIIDDWGLSNPDDIERRDLLEVLEDRTQKGATIVTSQIPVEKWYDVIGEPTISDAILDRLIHNSHKLQLNGPTMRDRKQEGKDAKGSYGDDDA
jgi:DNA replication protein DnaC